MTLITQRASRTKPTATIAFGLGHMNMPYEHSHNMLHAHVRRGTRRTHISPGTRQLREPQKNTINAAASHYCESLLGAGQLPAGP
ncbi:hypothetical protein GCM10027288_10740 [Bordetella tumbae]